MKQSKNKTGHVIVALCVGFAAVVAVTGCSTPEQRASLQPVTPPPAGTTLPPPPPGAANDSRFNPNSPANGGNRPK